MVSHSISNLKPMRTILFLILLMAEGWRVSIFAQASGQRILEQLDQTISRKEEFQHHKEAVISQIKQRLTYAADHTERYKLCGELFNLILPAIIFTVKNTTTLSSLSRRETSKFPSIGQK